jgi:hypothetical protein
MKNSRKLLTIIGALVVGAGVGTALATTTPGVQSETDLNRPRPTYQKNASGETFGSLSQAEVDADAPTLIAAVGTNGVDGYVRSADLLLPLPKDPEEALALKDVGVRYLTLYAVDGRTIVGQYRSGTISTIVQK